MCQGRCSCCCRRRRLLLGNMWWDGHWWSRRGRMGRDERPLVTRQRCFSSGPSECSPRPSDGSIRHRHGYRWNDVMRTKSELTTLFGGLGQRNLGRCVSRRKFGLLCLVVGGFGTRMRVWWIWWRRNPLGGWYWRWPASGNSTWRLPRRCSCNWCCCMGIKCISKTTVTAKK